MICGVVPKPTEKAPNEHEPLRIKAGEIGADIARTRHALVVCSPFEGSADIEVLKGVCRSPRMTPRSRSVAEADRNGCLIGAVSERKP